ncbi:hypothetical protein GRF29_1g1027601 [Pseudopithomyces chartarum]|uniref:Uncharacterized protein n=1 Tax=Pseudopithomyces chartarum TaxID=1892770 RepID=A0AAN6RM03_9PLEO|nr:hypothetical protein GRF29_1g1027601 [Pseudopithomyces chartarum]
MRILTLAAISLFHASALAAPTESPFQSDPGDWGVYISTDWEWGNRETTGLFENFPVLGEDFCVNLVATGWDKTISSFGPAKGVKCVVYE